MKVANLPSVNDLPLFQSHCVCLAESPAAFAAASWVQRTLSSGFSVTFSLPALV